MTTTDPGWYPDSSVPGQQRYWDGQGWTEHVAPISDPPVSPDYLVRRAGNLARTAMICSLVGIIFIPAALVGLIMGIIALSRIRKSGGTEPGRGMAITGIAIGALMLILGVVAVISLATLAKTTISNDVTSADQTTAVANSDAAYFNAVAGNTSQTAQPINYPTGGPGTGFTASTASGITTYVFSDGARVCVTAPNTNGDSPALATCP